MRVLGIDLGDRRIGLALSDESGTHAWPHGVLARSGNERDARALCALAAEHDVGSFVVGLPLHMDGRSGPEAERARDFADCLARHSGLPVEMIDERWTTVEAERALRSMGLVGRKGRRRKERVDAMAASLMLRTWLDRRARPEQAHGG